MWNRKQLKANAKVAFKRNYWKCVLVALLLGLATGAVSSGTSAYNTYNETQYIMSDEYYEEDFYEEDMDDFYEYDESEDVLDDVIPGGLEEASSSIFTTITLAVVLIIFIIVFVTS